MLVRIYLFVCQRYRGRLGATAQRQSNNSEPGFTDEEVLTIYLFGLFKKRETIREIHEYAEDHFFRTGFRIYLPIRATTGGRTD